MHANGNAHIHTLAQIKHSTYAIIHTQALKNTCNKTTYYQYSLTQIHTLIHTETHAQTRIHTLMYVHTLTHHKHIYEKKHAFIVKLLQNIIHSL